MSDRALVLLALASWAGFAITVMALDRFASGSGRRPRVLRFLTEDRGEGWEPMTVAPRAPSWTTTRAGAAVDWRHLGDPQVLVDDAAIEDDGDVSDADGDDEWWWSDDEDDWDDEDDDGWDLPDIVDDDGFAYDFGTELRPAAESRSETETAAEAAQVTAAEAAQVIAAEAAQVTAAEAAQVTAAEAAQVIAAEAAQVTAAEVLDEPALPVEVATAPDPVGEVVPAVPDDDTGPLAEVHVLDPSNRPGPEPDPFFSELIRRLSDRVAETVRLETRNPEVSSDDEAPPAIDREAATG